MCCVNFTLIFHISILFGPVSVSLQSEAPLARLPFSHTSHTLESYRSHELHVGGPAGGSRGQDMSTQMTHCWSWKAVTCQGLCAICSQVRGRFAFGFQPFKHGFILPPRLYLLLVSKQYSLCISLRFPVTSHLIMAYFL